MLIHCTWYWVELTAGSRQRIQHMPASTAQWSHLAVGHKLYSVRQWVRSNLHPYRYKKKKPKDIDRSIYDANWTEVLMSVESRKLRWVWCHAPVLNSRSTARFGFVSQFQCRSSNCSLHSSTARSTPSATCRTISISFLHMCCCCAPARVNRLHIVTASIFNWPL